MFFLSGKYSSLIKVIRKDFFFKYYKAQIEQEESIALPYSTLETHSPILQHVSFVFTSTFLSNMLLFLVRSILVNDVLACKFWYKHRNKSYCHSDIYCNLFSWHASEFKCYQADSSCFRCLLLCFQFCTRAMAEMQRT